MKAANRRPASSLIHRSPIEECLRPGLGHVHTTTTEQYARPTDVPEPAAEDDQAPETP